MFQYMIGKVILACEKILTKSSSYCLQLLLYSIDQSINLRHERRRRYFVVHYMQPVFVSFTNKTSYWPTELIPFIFKIIQTILTLEFMAALPNLWTAKIRLASSSLTIFQRVETTIQAQSKIWHRTCTISWSTREKPESTIKNLKVITVNYLAISCIWLNSD